MTDKNDKHPPKASPAPGNQEPLPTRGPTSWGAALGFLLIGAITTAILSVVMWTPFYFFYLYILVVLVGWIPFCLAGAIVAIVGWRKTKLRWYGFGMIVGALALYGPLIADMYRPG